MGEVREAAERCADGWGCDPSLDIPCGVAVELLADAQAVGRDWLASHPADDGEAVTDGWLRAVGGEPGDGADVVFTYADINVALALTEQGGGCWSAELGVGDTSSGNWPHDLRTRGDVRRLLAALGIPG